MVLFGSGGHSTEMLMLLQSARLTQKLERQEISRLICVLSEDDKLIEDKINKEFSQCEHKHKLLTVKLKRAREVGQSYLSAVWTTIIGLLNSISIIHKNKPRICITNGPAISVTITLAIRFLQMITLGCYYQCNVIYVESFCRTKTLSLSGKLIYHLRLANEFYVQWSELKLMYNRSRYRGLLV